jgi:hypothetical protein
MDRQEGEKAAVLCGRAVAGMWVFPHTTYQEIDNVDTIILEDNSQAL